MRPRCSVFIATSLDGDISSIDAMVLGRKTFDLVRSCGVWPVGHRRVRLLSRRGVDGVPELAARVGVHAGPLFGALPADLLLKLQSSPSFSTGLVQSTWRVRHPRP